MADIYFTQSQIDIISNYYKRKENAEGNYSYAYAAIAQMLPEGSNVRRWFESARGARNE